MLRGFCSYKYTFSKNYIGKLYIICLFDLRLQQPLHQRINLEKQQLSEKATGRMKSTPHIVQISVGIGWYYVYLLVFGKLIKQGKSLIGCQYQPSV